MLHVQCEDATLLQSLASKTSEMSLGLLQLLLNHGWVTWRPLATLLDVEMNDNLVWQLSKLNLQAQPPGSE